MEPKLVFARVLASIVLVAAGLAIGQIASPAVAVTGHTDANLFAPKLLVNHRPKNQFELADTWPLGTFVAIRLTSPPSYDPVFRLPDTLVHQLRRAPVAAHTDRVHQQPRTNAAPKTPVSEEPHSLLSF